jgi:hypothetical protein
MMAWIPWLRKLWKLLHMRLPLLFFYVDFVEHVRSIIFMSWNGFKTPLHTLSHSINLRF